MLYVYTTENGIKSHKKEKIYLQYILKKIWVQVDPLS